MIRNCVCKLIIFLFVLPTISWADEIIPKDINAKDKCERYVLADWLKLSACKNKDEGKTKSYYELTGKQLMNTSWYFLCRNGKWYQDRKKSRTIIDDGTGGFTDRCEYINNL